MPVITAVAIGAVFGMGVYLVLQRQLIRAAMGLVLIGNAVNLFLLAAGAYNGAAMAYTTMSGQRSDALPQALVLTAIVISMGGFAFMLALLTLLSARRRTNDSDDISGLRH